MKRGNDIKDHFSKVGKMVSYCIWLIIFITFQSCNTEKAAQRKIARIQKNHPQLFTVDTTYIIKKDTLMVQVPKYVFDTIIDTDADTIIVETNRFKTQIQIIKEPFETTKYLVKTEVKQVEIPVEVIDTVFTIKEQIKVEKQKYIPWWYRFLLMLTSLMLLYSVISYVRLAWHLGKD